MHLLNMYLIGVLLEIHGYLCLRYTPMSEVASGARLYMRLP
jgi:hypothetical protein